MRREDLRTRMMSHLVLFTCLTLSMLFFLPATVSIIKPFILTKEHIDSTNPLVISTRRIECLGGVVRIISYTESSQRRGYVKSPLPIGWQFHTYDLRFPFWCMPAINRTETKFLHVITSGCSVLIPFWIPLSVTLILSSLVWRLRYRRISPGHCQQCRYDLTGNTSGICPECGSHLSSVPDPPAS